MLMLKIIYVNKFDFFQLEPFYVKLALFDAAKGVKLLEDFHVDFNDLESTTVTRDDTGDVDLDFVKLAKATNQVLECSSSFVLYYFYYS